jgi:hypothetical protein
MPALEEFLRRSRFRHPSRYRKMPSVSTVCTRTENMTTNNKPAFEIFVVREGSNKKSYFTKIGAAWPTKSGSGYNADLIALSVDGKFILLPPKDKEDASE